MSGLVRVATRGSAQARTQAGVIADALRAGGIEAELVLIETTGDRRLDLPLHSIGGQGVFVKEVQQAVLDGRADVAVHSAKDVPAVSHDELVIAAFSRRRSPGDALIGRTLDQLAPGAPVATGSVRRRAQLAAARPDLRFVELRGNIPTRLSRVPDDGAVVMAIAALEVLGMTDQIAEPLDPGHFVPSPGQGCVAVECRADDTATRDRLALVDDAATRAAVTAERRVLAELGTGCSLPVGAHAADGRLRAFLAAADPLEVPAPRCAWADAATDGTDDGETARQLVARLRAALGD